MQERDMKQLKKLLSQCDVFVTNLRAGALERMELHYSAIKVEFPGLVRE